MNLAKINLNLLVILSVLLEEKNVSRAAKRLFRTQSAVSTTLNQLRDLFQDRLLIRARGGMVLTPLSEQLAPQLKIVLRTVTNFMDNSREFIPEKSNRIFSIGVAEYIEFIFSIPLYKHFTNHSPNMKLDFKRVITIDGPEDFKSNSIDLMITAFPKLLPKNVSKELLLKDKFVCVMRKEHPLAEKKKLTREDYTSSLHLGISQLNQLFKRIDMIFEEKGLKRNVPLLVSHIFPGMQFVETSDFVVTLPSLMAKQLATKFNIVYFDLPFQFFDIELFQVWPSYATDDPGLKWLREAVKTIVRELY